MPKKAKTKERAKPKAAKTAAPQPGLAKRVDEAAAKPADMKGLEAVAGKPGALLPEAKATMGKVPSGVPGLDKLIEGGFEQKSVVIVTGGPGTGKTTFGLQFLYEGAAKHGESGMYISFEDEDKAALYRHMARYGLDFAKLEKEKKFAFVTYPPEDVERYISEGGILEDLLREMGVKRIVIDTVTSYLMIHKEAYERRKEFIKLMEALRKWGCTTLLISDGEGGEGGEGHAHADIEFIADGLIDMSMVHHGGAAGVELEIVKMRGVLHARAPVPVKFTAKGIAVAAP